MVNSNKTAKVLQFLETYKIPDVLIAKELGITAATYWEKKKGTRYSKFSTEQEEKLTKFIQKMGKELTKV